MTVPHRLYKIGEGRGIQLAMGTLSDSRGIGVNVDHFATLEYSGQPATSTASRSRYRPLKRSARHLLSILAIVLLAGCGRSGSTPVAVTPAATVPATTITETPPPATPSAQGPQFSEIVWTSDWSDRPGEEPLAVTQLRPDSPAIIALTRARMLPDGARIDATWTYNDTSLDSFTTGTTSDNSSNDVWLAFRLDRDPEQLWPAGTYEIVLTLDGAEVERSAIQIAQTP